MHNSFHIRQLLRDYCRDPVFRQRRDPHRTVTADPNARAGENEFVLEGTWSVQCQAPAEAASALQADLEDFFQHMNVPIQSAGGQPIVLALDDQLAQRDCRLSCTPEKILIEGGGIAGLWAGVAWMEWEMRTRRGPILPLGVQERKAAWPIQISQGPVGGNYSVPDFSPEYLDDDAFRRYAHYGINSMMIYGDLLCYVQSRILPELNHPEAAHHLDVLKEAARRAARYGVRFAYVPVGPKLRPDHPVFQHHPKARGTGVNRGDQLVHFLCSSDTDVLRFYEETFENLFSAVPELAGVILITFCESFYHCRIWGGAAQPCPVCTERPIGQMVGELVAAVQRGVGRGQRDAFTAMWMYSNAWYHGDRRTFYSQMPAGSAVFYHLEKDSVIRGTDFQRLAWDYSIACQGPGPRMAELADYAHASGRPLFVKTETATGAEFMQFPYVPAMQQLAQKWQRVRDLKPAGVHQSWLFYGMFGSRAEELGLWAAYATHMPYEEFLRRMAERDFGRECAADVLRAWEALSRAVRRLPCMTISDYYQGPGFLGPAHPLVPEPDAAVPDVFYGTLFYLQEMEETFSVRRTQAVRTCLAMRDLPIHTRDIFVFPDDVVDYGWGIVIREYAAAAAEAQTAWTLLRNACGKARTAADIANLREETQVVELVFRTIFACENTTRFFLARRNGRESGEARYRREMGQIARRERENALAARSIYEALPWLDVAKRIDGKFASSIAMIDAKIDWIDQAFPSSGEGADASGAGPT